MPKISVIMPVYNSEKYLNLAINSILSQTFKDFELIIVNDASTDRSEEIVLSYDDSRIVYLKNNENYGVSYSVNRAIEMAQGEYIARADSDDIYYSERLEQQFEILESYHKINICSFDLELINEEGNNVGSWNYNSDNSYMKAQLLFDSSLPNPALMFRKNLFNKGLRYDTYYRKAEDYELFVRLDDDFTVFHIQKTLMKYRRHKNSLSFDFNNLQTDADKVRKKALMKIGLDPTEPEFYVHQLLCGVSMNNEDKEINILDLINWIERIRTANKEVKYYSIDVLDEILLGKLCNYLERNKTTDVKYWSIFWNYYLVKNSNLPELSLKINKMNEILSTESKIAIFGTGRIGMYLYGLLKKGNYNVISFIDNNEKMLDKKIDFIPIISQKEVKNDNSIDIILVSILGDHDTKIISEIKEISNKKLEVLSWKKFLCNDSVI
ncbi:hypothetical protein UACE39S_04176 [Ureibacillus acetophenoni]